jgi:hypothetical protein
MFIGENNSISKCLLAIVIVVGLALCAQSVFAQNAQDFEDEEYNDQIKEAEERFTEEVYMFLGEELPEAIKQLEQYRQKADSPSAGPEEKMSLAEALIYMAEVVEELTDMREYLPEAYEKLRQSKRLDIEAERLAERYHKESGKKEREEILGKIEDLLEKSFLISQDIRRMEAAQIEKELNEINTEIKNREEKQKVIIERRLHELLHGTDLYEW